MKTKIQIKSIFGKVLFEYEIENNSIKKTLEKAVEENANLYNANLYNANLENADLYNANLENANLRNANLINANLENANLENADLRNANLENADLYNANLSKSIKLPIYCKWSHGITNGNLIHIGCEKRTIEDWNKFFDSDEELETKRDTKEFKQIKAVFKAYEAYLNCLSEELEIK